VFLNSDFHLSRTREPSSLRVCVGCSGSATRLERRSYRLEGVVLDLFQLPQRRGAVADDELTVPSPWLCQDSCPYT
jgi:hypothetical protein